MRTCAQQEMGASLAIIRSKEEQDFITNFILKVQKVVDNVWIGVKFSNNSFKWTDHTDLSFVK